LSRRRGGHRHPHAIAARHRAACGTGSLAEAAALAALGPGARIVTAPRVTSPRWHGHRRHRQKENPHDRPFHRRRPRRADLITLRGRDLIAACPVCLYAGSLCRRRCWPIARPGARIVNTAPLEP
jgi:hypothetical protein